MSKINSVKITELEDALEKVVAASAASIDILKDARKEASKERDKWRDVKNRQIEEMIISTCPSLAMPNSAFVDCEMSKRLYDELQLLSSAMSLTTRNDLVSSINIELENEKDRRAFLASQPSIDVLKVKIDQADDAINESSKLAREAARKVRDIRHDVCGKIGPMADILANMIGGGITQLNQKMSFAKTVLDDPKVAVDLFVKEFRERSKPLPWYKYFSEEYTIAKSLRQEMKTKNGGDENEMRSKLIKLFQYMAAEMSLYAKVANLDDKKTEIKMTVDAVEKMKKSLKTNEDLLNILKKDITRQLLKQNHLASVARRLKLSELENEVGKVEAKYKVMDRLVGTTDAQIRKRESESETLKSNFDKVNKARRKKSSQMVPVDLSKIKELPKQMTLAASQWRSGVVDVRSRVSSINLEKNEQLKKFQEKDLAKRGVRSSASDSDLISNDVWFFYLQNQLFNANGHGATGSLMEASPADLRDWNAEKVPGNYADFGGGGASGDWADSTKSVVKDVESTYAALDFNDDSKSRQVFGLSASSSINDALGKDSWDNIDRAISSAVVSVESVHVSTCSTGPTSSCSSGTSSCGSSCGGGD